MSDVANKHRYMGHDKPKGKVYGCKGSAHRQRCQYLTNQPPESSDAF